MKVILNNWLGAWVIIEYFFEVIYQGLPCSLIHQNIPHHKHAGTYTHKHTQNHALTFFQVKVLIYFFNCMLLKNNF